MDNNLPMRELLMTKFSLCNKYVAKELWPLAAIMLWELVSEYDYYKNENRLREDGSFYSSINNIQEATWLKRKNQENAIATLEKANILIKVFDKSEWNKRFFKLNPDKIAEYTGYVLDTENNTPLCPSSTYPMSWEDIPPYVLPVHTLCPSSTYPMSWEDIAMSQEYNHKQIINNRIENNNKNNNKANTENFSNADASPSNVCDVETGLDSETHSKTKAKRKTKKQQRYDEVMTSTEFTTTVLEWITNEVEQEEIKTLWSEYVELRCSKDYRAFTDWAIRRNLKVLEGTTFPERRAILDKSVTKWWTGLFPLNEYDVKRIEWDLAKVEWSDEWLYDKIFTTKCKEKEDELPERSTHDLLMQLVQEYWEERVKKIYYERVRPKIEEIYWIKRDWVK